ncbi:MAG TPA: DUF4199 domain-containing protein [Phnomibacter sp.]|nr:DUF4199 domain-containing protein [Phnomibacter sp.]
MSYQKENQKVMTPPTKGFILGLIIVALAIVTYIFIPFAEQSKYGWVSFLVIAGGIIWACMSYGKQMDGNVTFGNVFAHGFKTTAVLTIIVCIYTVLSFTLIFPEAKDKALELVREQMSKTPGISEAQIETQVANYTKYMIPFTLAGVLVMYLIIGAISSLLGAVLTKRNPNYNPNATPFQ